MKKIKLMLGLASLVVLACFANANPKPEDVPSEATETTIAPNVVEWSWGNNIAQSTFIMDNGLGTSFYHVTIYTMDADGGISFYSYTMMVDSPGGAAMAN